MAGSVTEIADADLQGAAVAHQCRGTHTDRVVDRGDRRMRYRERTVIQIRRIQHDVEIGLGDLGIIAEPRHLAIDLRHCQPRPFDILEHRHDLQRHVRIAGQAQAPPAFVLAQRDRLQQQVHAARQHVARHMGVVAADVVLLPHRIVQSRTALDVELDDANIRRQRLRLQRIEILQPRIVAPHALADRPQHALFQIGRATRRVQRQRGDDVQRDRRIFHRPLIQGIEQRIRLTDAQRRAHHQALAEPPQNVRNRLAGMRCHQRSAGPCIPCAHCSPRACLILYRFSA